MKKIVLLALLSLSVMAVRAQEQEEAKILRVDVWDIPETEKMYTTIIPDTMRVVAMSRYNGQPIYILTPVRTYDEIIQFFKIPNTGDAPIGLEFVVTYIEDFSLLSRRSIRMLPEDKQVTAKAFNTKVKYLVMAKAPAPIVGKRVRDVIVPDWTRHVSSQMVDTSNPNATNDHQSQQQNDPATKPASNPSQSHGYIKKRTS